MASDDVRALAERCVRENGDDYLLMPSADAHRRLVSERDALARAVLAQETRPTWQPISSAPEDGWLPLPDHEHRPPEDCPQCLKEAECACIQDAREAIDAALAEDPS